MPIKTADFLHRPVERRNPFAAIRLPPIARLYRAAFRPRRRVARRFVGKPARRLFRLAYHGLGLGGTGSFRLTLPEGTRDIAFTGRNIQFGALYMPQYADGYEPETTALLDLVVDTGSVFFDVGANWGFYALYVASRPGFAGRVHAVEPMPATFKDLTSVVDQAGLAGTITCHNLALSDAAGRGHMVIDDGYSSGIARLKADADGVEVRIAALDELDLPAPTVIKIDVEGHEAAMLRGATQTITSARPMIIFENWKQPRSPEITMAPLKILADWDYVLFIPVWVREAAGVIHAIEDIPADPVLGLLPVSAATRFLLADNINLFACPTEKVAALAARFEAP